MKKILAAVLLTVVLVGISVINVEALTEGCESGETITRIEPRISTYIHAVADTNPDGFTTLVGCTITTVKNVELTICKACGLAFREVIIAEYGPYHSLKHN